MIIAVAAAAIAVGLYFIFANSSSTSGKPSPPTPPSELSNYPVVANYCQSGCDDHTGDTAPNFYMCPQMMLGSEEFVNAAKDDKNDWAYYGVASHFNGK